MAQHHSPRSATHECGTQTVRATDRDAGEDKGRARILADAFDAMERTTPRVENLATRTDLSETELRLRREIEEVRKEIVEVRREVKDLEIRITERISDFRGGMMKWIAGVMVIQTGVIIGALVGILRLLIPGSP